MITRLEMVLMRAGMLKRSMACKMPTKEKATPVKSTVGNITRVREAARAAVSGSYPSANRVTRGSANKMPSPVSRAVSRVITDKKLPPKRKASFFPRWVRYSLNTGMKQAAMAEANTTSKKTRGMRLAM